MKPVQMMIFIAVYQQFYDRCASDTYVVKSDCFFPMRSDIVLRRLKIKEPVYQLMLTRLVNEGWLERRKGKCGGVEYRLVFSKLLPFMEAENADGRS